MNTYNNQNRQMVNRGQHREQQHKMNMVSTMSSPKAMRHLLDNVA